MARKPRGLLPALGVAACLALQLHAVPVFASPTEAAALREKYDGMRDALARNQFGRPLRLDSNETDSLLEGDIYGVVDYPFSVVSAALKDPAHWCDVLILHLNIKYCSVSGQGGNSNLTVYVGSKKPQTLSTSFRMDYGYRAAADEAGYLRQTMAAQKGPLGTKNYRMIFEAIPLEAGRSFLHVQYAYSQGMMARLATISYLNTVARDKVGFTVLEKNGGKPTYVSGLRGAVERNTMRYYLAIETYLGSLSTPPREQLGKRLGDWFAFTERYPRQLHEVSADEYMGMKREEYFRQQHPGQ